MIFRVRVGFTVTRPVVPDEATSFVIVEARSPGEAQTLAALMPFALPCPFFGCDCQCEMPTSTHIERNSNG